MIRWTTKRLTLGLLLAATFSLGSITRAADEPQATPVLIKLIDQVEVPAQEAGVLADVAVREGDMVAIGDRLAQIDDKQPRLELRKAELEHLAAAKQAENDVKVRFATKSREVAESEWRRAADAEKRLSQSVSQTELDQLRLAVEKTTLEIEQAKQELDLIQVGKSLKENDMAIAEHGIDRRKIASPLAGQVVQVNRHRGEWVQPGQSILRIVRLDRLRAEGLVNAQTFGGALVGRRVKLTVKLDDKNTAEFPGVVTFVNPEIDPVSGQTRIWAEVENTNLALRPGLHGSLSIAPAAASVSAEQ